MKKVAVVITKLITVALLMPLHALALQDESGFNSISLEDVTPNDVSRAAVAFINLSTSPGIDGSVINVNKGEQRQTKFTRGSLGFANDFSLDWTFMNFYTSGSITAAHLDDQILFNTQDSREFLVNIDRQIIAIELSGGFLIPITKNLKVTPYISVISSNFKNDSDAQRLGANNPLVKLPPIAEIESTTHALTTAYTIDIEYERWLKFGLLEIEAQYASSTTKTEDKINAFLNFNESIQTLTAQARWNAPTSLELFDLTWDWHTYYKHTHFLNLNRNAIGFNYFHEIGIGADYQWNIKALNLFGVRYIGIRSSVLFGDDVEGVSTEIYFK
ncbi:hypothetical protein [Thalassotalea agarivorans]|uniref:Uncharacterized protein n=1 Tax=Thalassotalea agarivorans TaxID=349064 RepID=A0A1I0CJT3_THASX|nr:hypothetical protein [Thalassotalea agarivorans]SET19825.1 hypothetical protein SAMN05660429_01222 [Thalassotalea agarivorans]